VVLIDRKTHLHVYAASDRPKKLPGVAWVTPKIRKDVAELARKYCTKEKQEWFQEVLDHSELTRIVWDGEEGEGGLPGRPGHFAMRDKSGTPWEASVRVLGPLPDDVWGVPADRAEAIDDVERLTEEERKRVARTFFVNEGEAPVHPAWQGARLLDENQARAHDFTNPERFPAPHLRISAILLDDPTEEGLKKATVKELKSWLAQQGQRHSGTKSILIQRVLSCYVDTANQEQKAQQPRGQVHGGGRVGHGRKRRRVGRRDVDENPKSSSESGSSSDSDAPLVSPAVNQRNRPHSAARVRVRRRFARVFGNSDDERREAEQIRADRLRSDLEDDSSSEEWEPINAMSEAN